MNKGKNTNLSTFGLIGCLIVIILVVALCVCGFVLMALVATTSAQTEKSFVKVTKTTGESQKKIAIINVEGIIWDLDDGVHPAGLTSYILDSLDEVIQDDSYDAVIMRLNTPGGAVYDGSRIVEKIDELKSKDKMIVAVMEELAASGGYQISAPTDYIYAKPETMTGSIGVLLQTVEYDELLNKIGVEEITITNTKGTQKHPDELGDPESKDYQIYEGMLDQMFSLFTEIITEGRGLTREELEPYLDGRVLTGIQAKNAGLVDEFGDWEDAIEYVKEEKELDSPTIIEFKRFEFLGFSSFSGRVDAFLNQYASPSNKYSMRMYALPSGMISDTENEKE